MNDTNIVILRLGHRPFRDKRVTTHVCLTARALGANGVFLAANDPNLEKNINSITKRFGGNFFIKNNINPMNEIKKWKDNGGKICHLSMYGINYPSIIKDITKEKDILVIVGAEKVSGEYYRISDWNIAIGNQPHSEIAALSIFLDRYYSYCVNRDPLLSEFKNAKLEIIPTGVGKTIIHK